MKKTPAEHSFSYSRKEGWLLAHNIVAHDVDQRHGQNGFRRFWVPPEKKDGWRLCDCGWRPDLGPHYSALAE